MVTGSTSTRARVDVPTPRRPADLPVEILESKLYQPTVRTGVVPRPALIARLRAARPVPTVAVVAPAGYGKTTLLALWAEADERPFAWVSLDEHDNDPIVLLTHLAVALDRISPLPSDTFAALRSGGTSVPATVVPRLGSALARVPHPVVLVVDDVHELHDGAALDALVTLVGHVRGTTQIALAGRGIPVPLARQRAQGQVVEVDARDLAFTEQGARSLLKAAGAELPDDEVVALAQRTEGWAAGLYLAALSRLEALAGLRNVLPGAEDGLVADYLRTELLSGLSRRDLSFLTRTAVLDQLSGPLCDAVLQQPGSAAELDHLREENLFLVPLDGQHRWYRYHPLFRDLLRSHLDREAPASSPELLRRAADWYAADGQLETALHYARRAGDVDRVARWAIALGQPLYAAGRSATVMSWFEWIAEQGGLERHPTIAAQAAWLCVLTGRPAAADRWLALAERPVAAGDVDADAEGEGLAMWLTSVRAFMCRDGVEQMRRELEEAGRAPGAGSAADSEYPMRMFLSGVAHLLLADESTAEARFLDATELTDQARRTPLYSTLLAYRALLATRQGDWTAAEALSAMALSAVRGGHTKSHVTSALVFSVAARVALHRRDHSTARAQLLEAQRLRPLLSHAGPWYSVEAQLQMAEASLGLGDPDGARQLLRDADGILRRVPGLGTLGPRVEELRGRLGSVRRAGSAGPTLTPAELRVLPLLLTHLTLGGIADRLYLSRHTVKAQVESMYQKLGAHTRDGAVARARGLGLLEA
jgi:LuxR family transcriptional regulator, maltose regulon positive regulatory protein